MEYLVLSAVVAVNGALSLVILTRATRASSTAYFGLSTLCIAVWALSTLLMLFGVNRSWATIGLLLFLVTPMLVMLYMVLFARFFSGEGPKKKYLHTTSLTILTIFFVAISIFSLANGNAVLVTIQRGGNELDFQQWWYWLYGLYFLIMVLLAAGYLGKGVQRGRGRLRRRRRLALVGILGTSVLVISTNIILPLVGVPDLVWLGAVWSVFYIGMACYAIVKQGLFDMRLAFVVIFTYGLSLGVLAALYYVITLMLWSVFAGMSATEYIGGINVGIVLLLALLFQPIRRFFDLLTSRLFYQDSYRVNDFFTLLNKTLASTNNLRLLLDRTADYIGDTLRANDSSFVIYTGENRVEQVGGGHYSHVGYKEAQLLNEYIMTDEINSPKVLTMLDEDEDQLRRLMISHRLVIILPLQRQEVRLGYLLLGEHKRSTYSARDIRVIRTFADEVAIAIQNALSVEELRELNAHLEQRITSATRELRTSNVQLQRLDEVKDEFISMASHQLRTPLTSIKGYISMMLEGDMGEVTKEQKHILNEAFISSERMVRLIGDFLNVSRLQTGKFVIEKRPVDLARLVQRELEALEPNALAHGIVFTYKKPKRLPLVELDENKIQQVIMNFADNAIYYSKDKSKVKVTLKKVANSVELKVIDSGIGVPKAEQAHLFGKFYRAPNARKARPDGTGVGLYLAKRVIDAHKGTILFESEENKGSTFGFTLPLPKRK